MPNHFIVSSSNNSKEFICLSAQSSITILSALLINQIDNWQSLVGNAYLEISFSYTDETDKNILWSKAQPLHLVFSNFQKQPVIFLNNVFTSGYLSNNSNFYNHLAIKLVVSNMAEPMEWQIEYDNNLLEELV